MSDEKKLLNDAAISEDELENVSGGMTDWRQDQARAAVGSRTAILSESRSSKNSKNVKAQKNSKA